MLPRLPLTAPLPRITKTVRGKDVSTLGAFGADRTLTLTVRAPRALGASGVVLRIAADGLSGDGRVRDLPLSFTESTLGWDTYRLDLPLRDLPLGKTLFREVGI